MCIICTIVPYTATTAEYVISILIIFRVEARTKIVSSIKYGRMPVIVAAAAEIRYYQNKFFERDM